MQVIALIGADGRAVCESCEVADGFLSRVRGLLGRDALPVGAGLLLRPCSAVHTCFARFPIDAVFLDRELRVVDVVARLRPWRAAARRRAHAVLELPAGTAARLPIRHGEVLGWGVAPRSL